MKLKRTFYRTNNNTIRFWFFLYARQLSSQRKNKTVTWDGGVSNSVWDLLCFQSVDIISSFLFFFFFFFFLCLFFFSVEGDKVKTRVNMQAYNLFLSYYSSLWASFTLQACPKVLILIALFYVSVESLCM